MLIKKIALYSFLSGCVCYMCADFRSVSQSVEYAVKLCTVNVIPALFPFFIISGVFMQNIDAGSIPKPMRSLYSSLFGIDSCTLPVFVAGIVSGYPVGAAAAYDMYKNGMICRSDAERLICFTNNSGPLFVISAVGAGIFGSVKYGIVLYIIHIISAVVTGITISAKHTAVHSSPSTANRAKLPLTAIIEDSFMKCIRISGFVIIFCIINSAVGAVFGDNTGAAALAACITEITGGIAAAAVEFPLELALPVASFALGWSGISVLLQVKSVCCNMLSVKKYIFAKIYNGVISAAICSIYVHFAAQYASTAAYVNPVRSEPIIVPILIGAAYIIIFLYWQSRFADKKTQSTA